MVAYIDEYQERFKVGPICRVLSGSLDCGFLTSRGYRMFKTRPGQPHGRAPRGPGT